MTEERKLELAVRDYILARLEADGYCLVEGLGRFDIKKARKGQINSPFGQVKKKRKRIKFKSSRTLDLRLAARGKFPVKG